MKTNAFTLLVVLALACTVHPVQAQFTYTISGGEVTITGYNGPGGEVVIPDTIEGLSVRTIGHSAFQSKTAITGVTIPDSVTRIGTNAFRSCTSLTTIAIPDSVTSIGSTAFYGCTSLRSVYFVGNAPETGYSIYSSSGPTVSYYLPGRAGWGGTFGGRPTAVWLLRADDLAASTPEDVALHGLVANKPPSYAGETPEV